MGRFPNSANRAIDGDARIFVRATEARIGKFVVLTFLGEAGRPPRGSSARASPAREHCKIQEPERGETRVLIVPAKLP